MGNDADAFDIDEDTGAVTFESPDYESGVTSYDFTITASDGSLTDDRLSRCRSTTWSVHARPAIWHRAVFVGEAMDI